MQLVWSTAMRAKHCNNVQQGTTHYASRSIRLCICLPKKVPYRPITNGGLSPRHTDIGEFVLDLDKWACARKIAMSTAFQEFAACVEHRYEWSTTEEVLQ